MTGDTENTFTITGKDKRGKRFIIHTLTPQHYNIWCGTVWYIKNGKRQLIIRYYG